ncbi:MAG: hypothetical protein WA982_00625 [Rubrobacteraceae bacterium]
MATVRSKPARSSTKGNATPTKVWLWLTAPITALVAIAAGSGLFVEGLYRDAPYFVAQAVGQDLITLVVALPVLVISAILTARGSHRANLVWLGILVYLVYSYVIYALAVQFNPLFLVYVALLGFSLYALIGGLATTDFAGIKARFSRETPAKAASIFLVVLAALFYFMWLSETIPALLAGEVPQSVTDNGTPTNAVHVLDMAWILPAMLLSSFWLWKRRALGYTLAGVMLTFGTMIVLAVMAMVVSMSLLGQAVAIGQAAIFAIVAAVILGMLAWYLRGLGESQR